MTHGKPCVNMHGTLRAINRSSQIQFGQAANSVRGGSSKGGKEKRKGGKERRNGRKERRKERRK